LHKYTLKMSKRDLKKYLQELDKSQLEEQIIELYDKFSPIKVYYDFVFNPKEDTLLKECKIKISNEYYPARTSGKPRRPKMRRSVAQKYIKHFILLGVDSFIIGDIMLYAIEIAQTFSAEKPVKSETFYKSMLSSFEQAVRFMIANGILEDFRSRIVAISNETNRQNWFNKEEFNAIIERFEY
jgi:putative NIF3 family GTP cyclohydrolase 1 type 2